MASIAQESVAQDGHEANATTWEDTTSLWRVGKTSGTYYDAGLRFTTIPDIASGNTIDSATLSFVVSAAGGAYGTASFDVHCENEDDGAVFGASARPSQKTPTTAKTAETISATGTKNIDVKTAVQEVISRGGWAADNDLNFLLIHSEAAGSPYDIAYVTDSQNSGVTTLDITYTAGGGGLSIPIAAHHYQEIGT